MTYEFQCQMGPGISLPTRSTFLHQDDGKLFIISPGPFDEATYKEIEALSDRIILVAPNMVHHMFLQQSFERWHKIEIYGDLGLWKAKKQPWIKPYLKDIRTIHEVLSTNVKAMYIRGNPFLSETVFFDTKSKTLIVTDLVFNMDKSSVNFPTGLMLRIFGTYNRLAQSRLLKLTTKNKLSFLTSMKKVLEYDFKRVIPAHGNVIEDPKAFKEVLQKQL